MFPLPTQKRNYLKPNLQLNTLGFEGEQTLMVAILERSKADIKGIQHWNSKDAIREAKRAYAWFYSTDSDWVFSFSSICAALGLEEDAVLDELRIYLEATKLYLPNERK